MTSVHACTSTVAMASPAARLSVAITRMASRMAPAVSRSCLAAVVMMPSPSGFVSTRTSPGRPPALVATRAGCTIPVTASP